MSLRYEPSSEPLHILLVKAYEDVICVDPRSIEACMKVSHTEACGAG